MVIAVVFLPVARCSEWLMQLCFCMLPGVLHGYCSCVSACCQVFRMVNAVVFLYVTKFSIWLLQLCNVFRKSSVPHGYIVVISS